MNKNLQYYIVRTPLIHVLLTFDGEFLEKLTFINDESLPLELMDCGELVNYDDLPAGMKRLSKKIIKHLSGGPQDFSDINWQQIYGKLPSFRKKIYKEVSKIPPGSVLSYKEVAKRCGSPRAMRAVGAAMGQNPIPLVIPCHRVIATNGKLCGFSAPTGILLKEKLLRLEGFL